MTFCKCSATLTNTGTPNKQRVVKTGSKLFAVLMKADDGTANGIANTDVIDQAYLDALVNHEDYSKRWYPIGEFVNVADERADPATESFSDGSSSITQQGVRAFDGFLLEYAPKYIDNLRGFSCFKFGLIIVDNCGAVQGSISSDGTLLKPIRVNEQSWNPQYVKGSDAATARIQLRFEFSQLEADQNLRVIDEDEVTADFLDAAGLVELSAAISSITTTGFIAAITIDYDEFLDLTEVVGWVDTDFALYNETTSSTIAITSVTESPDGTYTFVMPPQTSADVLRLTNVKTSGNKPGFNLKEPINIP